MHMDGCINDDIYILLFIHHLVVGLNVCSVGQRA